MTTLRVERETLRGEFILLWVVATTIAWLVGGMLLFGIGWGVGDVVARSLGDPLGGAVGFGLGGAIGGAVIGAGQWLVLRRYLARAVGWIGASAAGHALGMGAGLAVGLAVNAALGARPDEGITAVFVAALALAGLVVGVAQWRVLRRERRGAAWWIAVSAASFMVLFAVANFFGGEGREFIGLAAGGLALSLISAPVMAWLLRQPPPAGG